MDLRSTQLKDTYGNLLTIGTTAGSPTSGTLQNGDGEDISILTIGNSTSTNHRLTLQDSTTSARILITSGDFYIDGDIDGGNNRDIVFTVDGGDESMRLESNGDISFRDTSNNEALYWDASTARLGIGETSPASPLSVEFADSGTTQQTFKGLILANSNSTTNNGAVIAFPYGGSSSNSFARIGAIHTNRSSASETTDLFFGTIHNGTYGERLRIDSSGNVGIGTTSPDAVLHVNKNSFPETNEKLIRFNAGTANYRSNRYIEISNSFTGSGYVSPALVFKTNANASNQKSYGLIATLADGSISLQNKPAGSELAIGTDLGTTEKMRIDSSGDVLVKTADARIGSDVGSVEYGTSTNNSVRFYQNDQERIRIDNGGNLMIGTTVTPTSSEGNIVLKNGTAPTGNATDGIILYAEDVSTSSELKVRDEAGNVTTLSPHNFSLIPDGASEEMAWAYYSERDGKKINVDMLKLARMVESLTGEKLVYEQ